jgi:hypothetical protein
MFDKDGMIENIAVCSYGKLNSTNAVTPAEHEKLRLTQAPILLAQTACPTLRYLALSGLMPN